MESRRTTSLVFTFIAALGLLFTMTPSTRTPAKNPAPATDSSKVRPGAPEEESASLDFPTAKDLVSAFLFRHDATEVAPSGHLPADDYTIDLLVATVPDPVSSRLPHFFDTFVGSLESAAEAAGYTLDRFALPWVEKEHGEADTLPAWQSTLYESVPGLILFRNPHDHKLLLVFLVGETPTTGIHKQAMFSALEQMAQFYPWDPKHADLPAGFPQTPDPGSVDTLRVMGPAFSGSSVSLRFVLDRWSEARGNPSGVRFQIISGTATAIDAGWLAQSAHGHATYQATVPPDSETLQAAACYIGGLGDRKIAILSEGNTAYGQNVSNQSAAGKGSGDRSHGACPNGKRVPAILSLPFPLDVSRVRAAASNAAPQTAQNSSGTGGTKPFPRRLEQQNVTKPREVIPSFSELSVQSAELTLSNLFSTIAREQFGYVGIVATDVRDATFLAREVQDHCPATVLFTINSDLLFAYPDVNNATRGMLIVTPYPLFNLEQLWTYAYGGDKTRLQFSNQAAEGVYNAALALLHQDGRLVDYGTPLAAPADAEAAQHHQPSLWLTAIGSGEALPIRLLPWKDDGHYTYSPPAGVEAMKRLGTATVGRGIYAENIVVAFIAFSIVISVIALLLVSQYWRPEKRGVGLISALMGDTASSAYWAECRLFLLCAAMSLLSIYVVIGVAFCLPFAAGRALGSSLQTTATPKIAAAIAAVALVLVFMAVHTLVSAFRKAPPDQRGFAPEVVVFTLLGCLFVFVLAGILGFSWLQGVNLWPASAFFIHLRSFDFRGGLSPLPPLTCVAMGACLWALCSFRRLRLLDILRATGTAEKPRSWLSFVSLDVRSFSGVRELENSVKHILESSSVLSLRWYSWLAAAGLLVGHYFFTTRLVWSLEPRPFYWLFEGAFILVYWALLMEFLRLVFAWRSLHLLLQRLSWHPLLTAFKRYRDCRPNLARINLTRPPSTFAALESSVDQAGRLVRAANTLVLAADIGQGLHEMLRRSIPEWEVQVQTAATQLSDALRLEWADDSRSESDLPTEAGKKMRASRIQGNWRQALKARCHAHHALYRLLQSLGNPMETYWSALRVEGEPPALSPSIKEFFDQGEEFIVGRMVNLLSIIFPLIQNLGAFVLAGLLLMLLAVTSYPFQPRNEFLFFNWVVILSFMGTIFWIFVQMDRDTILSLLNNTVPGQINFSRELVLRALLYVAVPLLALLGAQFPESLRQILSLFTAAQGGS